jgi:Peptidase family M28
MWECIPKPMIKPSATREARVGGPRRVHQAVEAAPFSQKGIPTVGLYTGAGGLKSEIQARFFGGAADQPYDPCYHRTCDTIENINRDVLEQNTRALVRALNVAAIAAQALPTPHQMTVDSPEPKL